MSYIHHFFSSLPSIGWCILAALLLLWGLLHAYEGFLHTRLATPYLHAIKRIKRLFKPSLLIVATIMALIALLSNNKVSVDKQEASSAEYKALGNTEGRNVFAPQTN